MTESKLFEFLITGCIIANTLVMGMVYYGMSDSYSNVLEWFNFIFGIIFNIEMILKLLSLGCSYFTSYRNLFDAFIVIGTDMGLVLKYLNVGGNISSATSVVRGFRIMRIFRLVRASVSIKLIIDTLINILPQITNIMSLMGILLFIYAALGINLFSEIMPQDVINEKNNF